MLRRLINIFLVLALIGGIGAMLFPTISDQYSKYKNTIVMSAYVRAAQELPTEEMLKVMAECEAYNNDLTGKDITDAFSQVRDEEVSAEYMGLLNPAGDGVMGIIEIPKLGVTLPIYHTTGNEGLENGVGHVEGTSMPLGGETLHCVLAGHRGLPTARLFTDLDQMVEGDLFYIKALNETHAYQVDQILIVEPEDTSEMRLFPGKDYITLVTCTPYGINSHRLLVRGERVEISQMVEVLSVDGVEAMETWKTWLLFFTPLFAPIWLVFMIIVFHRRRR